MKLHPMWRSLSVTPDKRPWNSTQITDRQPGDSYFPNGNHTVGVVRGNGIAGYADLKALLGFGHINDWLASQGAKPLPVFATMHGNTGFTPLPVSEHTHGMDDLCSCAYCSADERVSVCTPTGIWDTLATSLVDGKTWRVHFPDLHGRRKLR